MIIVAFLLKIIFAQIWYVSVLYTQRWENRFDVLLSTIQTGFGKNLFILQTASFRLFDRLLLSLLGMNPE